LLASDDHSRVAEAFSWAPAGDDDCKPSSSSVALGQAHVAALHAVYEDSKYNVLHSSYVPYFRRCLYRFASALGAETYSRFYLREEGLLGDLPQDANSVLDFHAMLQDALNLQPLPDVQLSDGTRMALLWRCWVVIHKAFEAVSGAKEAEEVSWHFNRMYLDRGIQLSIRISCKCRFT